MLRAKKCLYFVASRLLMLVIINLCSITEKKQIFYLIKTQMNLDELANMNSRQEGIKDLNGNNF